VNHHVPCNPCPSLGLHVGKGAFPAYPEQLPHFLHRQKLVSRDPVTVHKSFLLSSRQSNATGRQWLNALATAVEPDHQSIMEKLVWYGRKAEKENVRYDVLVCCLILRKLYHKKQDVSIYVIVFIYVFINQFCRDLEELLCSCFAAFK